KNVFLALLLLILSVLLLNKTTNSAYKDRFSDFNATGRSQIARFEMKAFFENPLLGLGPGGAKIYRSEMDLAQASHTEYTRLLAEHGLFGLACILIQIYLLFRILLSKVSAKDKMLSFSLMLWAVLFMTHAGMRLAAPAILFGLGAAGLSGAKSAKTATGFRPNKSRPINWPEPK
ncbi:MAG: hypothetical protein KDC71_24325, partial [Acidobacteria bacterium]|nr:hypothetical protein [Acidobacteriota bacterium]